MLPKITLEKFLEIKKILQERLESLQKEYEDIDSNELTQQQQEEIIRDFVEKYCSIQNELFNYDLSDIPFELWEGMAIMSNDYLINQLNTCYPKQNTVDEMFKTQQGVKKWR